MGMRYLGNTAVYANFCHSVGIRPRYGMRREVFRDVDGFRQNDK